MGEWLDWMILWVFSNLGDSMILRWRSYHVLGETVAMVEKKALCQKKLSYIKMKLLLGQLVAALYPLLRVFFT